jgi:hypothetical protein
MESTSTARLLAYTILRFGILYIPRNSGLEDALGQVGRVLENK